MYTVSKRGTDFVLPNVNQFSNVCISQRNVATRLRCGGNFYTHFIAHFIFFIAVKQF